MSFKDQILEDSQTPDAVGFFVRVLRAIRLLLEKKK